MNFIWCYAPLILEIMTEQEIKKELCYYDTRNPDNSSQVVVSADLELQMLNT